MNLLLTSYFVVYYLSLYKYKIVSDVLQASLDEDFQINVYDYIDYLESVENADIVERKIVAKMESDILPELKFLGPRISLLDLEQRHSLFHLSLISGNLEACELLLKYGEIDVNIKGLKEFTPLHAIATKKTDIFELAKLLIDYGADVNAKNDDYFTPLHLFAWRKGTKDSLKLIQLLLENGAKVNALVDGFNFLHGINYVEFSPAQFHELVEIVVKHGMVWLFSEKAEQYYTPLHYAFSGLKNDPEEKTIQLLYDMGLSLTKNTERMPLLYSAVRGGRSGKFLKLLVKLGVPICEIDDEGQNLFHLAARFGHLDAFHLALERDKCDIDLLDLLERSPLYYALIGVDKTIEVEITKRFLENDANPNLKLPSKITYLKAVGIVKPIHAIELIKLLIDYGADPHAPYLEEGESFLLNLFTFYPTLKCGVAVKCRSTTYSTPNGDEEGVMISPGEFHELVVYLASEDLIDLLNHANDGIQVPFLKALMIIEINRETLALIHSAGFDFNKKNANGLDILSTAVISQRDVDFIKELISLGANYNYLFGGCSYLHTAAGEGTVEQLRFFLEIGKLDVNLINDIGHTPLHRALFNQDATEYELVEKVRLLMENGAECNAEMFRDMEMLRAALYRDGISEMGRYNVTKLMGIFDV